MPDITQSALFLTELSGVLGSELPAPISNRLIRDGDTALGLAVKHARKKGDLEAEIRKLDGEIARFVDNAEDLLASLPLWEGPIKEAVRLPVPSRESVSRFGNQFDELAGNQAFLHEHHREVSERLEQIASAIAELESRGVVPTEEELKSARAERDERWYQVREAWVEGALLVEKTPEALASEYEHRVHQADELADRLRHDADRVAKHFSHTQERQRCERKLAELDSRLRKFDEKESALEEKWHAYWKPAGIKPLPPVDMLAWLARHEKLVSAANQLNERQGVRQTLLREMETQRDRCSKELASLGEPQAAAEASFSILLERAEKIIEDIEAIEQSRSSVSQELKRAAVEREGLLKDVLNCQKNSETWSKSWSQAIQPLGLSAITAPEEAEFVLNRFSSLFDKIKDIDDIEARIDHIKRDARRFSERVTKLTTACAPDLTSLPAEEAASELDRRLKKGKEDSTNRSNLEKRLKRIGQELEELKRDREGAQATLHRLIENAGCGTPEELEDLERRSAQYREGRSKLADREEQLLGEGVPIEELVEQAKAIDPDRLPGEVDNLKGQVRSYELELKNLDQQMGILIQKKIGMDGSDIAAMAAAEAQEALAEIKSHVEEYVRLKLALLLLDREIKRYREQNEGTILKRAGEIFRQSTLDSYIDLSTGFTGDDKLALVCVRSSGERVSIDGLSDGANDQLYLALRLAGIEEHVGRNEPLPLVVDDALIKFDDRRAQATLKLLDELSEKTQVLFFTHHSRLVQLASDAIPSHRLKIHDLDELGSSAENAIRNPANPS